MTLPHPNINQAGAGVSGACDVSRADALCIGSWTGGLFVVRQHATQPTMEFIDQVKLDGESVAVFCTHKHSPGWLLDKITRAVEARGGRVTGAFRSRGPEVADGFTAWLDSLESG